MEHRIEHVEGFKLAGVRDKIAHGEAFSDLWDTFFDRVPEEEFKSLGFSKGYGVLINMDEEATDYMVGYEYENEAKVKEMDLAVIEIPSGDYVKLKVVGPIDESIVKGWEYLWGNVLETGEFEALDSPSLEVYFPGDLYSKKYEMEIWVPVRNV